jgi:cysteine-rich repeat protein
MKNYRWMLGAVALACAPGCGDDGTTSSMDGTDTGGPTNPTMIATTTTLSSTPTEGTSETDPSGGTPGTATDNDTESAEETAVTIQTASEETLPPTSAPDTDATATDTDATTSDTTGPPPGCGDGAVDDGEACDDGNDDNTDTCLDTCVSASCGDGFVGPGEACDDGNMVDDDECSNACALTSCGDGIKQPDEACDDGNQVDTDACLSTCVAASCGDGFVGPGEACDDGNPDDTDTCLSTCEAASCGDGFIGPGEACDDANQVDDDECSNTCSEASCGDGVKQMGEECDDGDDNNMDACLDTCVNASCGDGFQQTGVEECDDGNADDTDECLTSCEEAICGDGFVQAGVEMCDDGNLNNTDGCVAMCKAASCGDGFVQAGVEMCDDGNAQNNDSCDNMCKPAQGAKAVEAGWYHTCAVTFAGKVHCWGRNDQGQLGQGNIIQIGDTEFPSTIPAVDLGGTAVALALGENHSCALLDSGDVRCWGDSATGETGLGTVSDLGNDEKPSIAQPINVGGKVVQITAGRNHTCALLDTKKVRCWGAGVSGALGYNNTNNIGDGELPFSAGDVTVGADVEQVTAGDTFTCVRTSADNARCWGLGTSGRLGYGNVANIGDTEFPSSAGDINVGAKVKFIAAGASHTCVITDTNNVRCWGLNSNGQLGYGHTNTIGDGEFPNVSGNVSLGDPIVQVTAGLQHTCAVTMTGAVRCWGNSTYGQLGQGNTIQIGDTEVPSTVSPIDVGGPVTQIAANWFHSCVRLDTGGLRCWGRSNYGQLGYGNVNNVGAVQIPAAVSVVPWMP